MGLKAARPLETCWLPAEPTPLPGLPAASSLTPPRPPRWAAGRMWPAPAPPPLSSMSSWTMAPPSAPMTPSRSAPSPLWPARWAVAWPTVAVPSCRRAAGHGARACCCVGTVRGVPHAQHLAPNSGMCFPPCRRPPPLPPPPPPSRAPPPWAPAAVPPRAQLSSMALRRPLAPAGEGGGLQGKGWAAAAPPLPSAENFNGCCCVHAALTCLPAGTSRSSGPSPARPPASSQPCRRWRPR